jgi:hypothetical protein
MRMLLAGDALEAIQDVAEDHGISEGEAIGRAVAVLKFLSDEMARGTVFRMHASDGRSERFQVDFTGGF